MGKMAGKVRWLYGAEFDGIYVVGKAVPSSFRTKPPTKILLLSQNTFVQALKCYFIDKIYQFIYLFYIFSPPKFMFNVNVQPTVLHIV